jgi:DNA-directed RNA polymerase subunit N (RpoN/RPB10)
MADISAWWPVFHGHLAAGKTRHEAVKAMGVYLPCCRIAFTQYRNPFEEVMKYHTQRMELEADVAAAEATATAAATSVRDDTVGALPWGGPWTGSSSK